MQDLEEWLRLRLRLRLAIKITITIKITIKTYDTIDYITIIK